METNKTTIKNFTDLVAWKEAHALVLSVYQMTKFFPKDEIFGLTSQLRRAAVSITSNIAEGFGRRTSAEKRQFYNIAAGSIIEIQSQLLIAKDLEYASAKDVEGIYSASISVHKLVNGLIGKFL